MNYFLSFVAYAIVVVFTVSTLAAGLWLLWIWRDVTIERMLQLTRQERQRKEARREGTTGEAQSTNQRSV